MADSKRTRPVTGVPDELRPCWSPPRGCRNSLPDAVLVGDTAAALHAHHRTSQDHDHVVRDLRDRFEVVLDALEAEPDWVTNRVTPGKVVLGRLGEIEAGVRQLIRTSELETEQFELASGATVVVPTIAETLRVKAFLIVKRNQVRDFLDAAALADRYGAVDAADVLTRIDDYYRDDTTSGRPVASQLVRQLGDVRPKDSRTVERLGAYKGLAARWTDWNEVRRVCAELAAAMIGRTPPK